MRMYLSTLLREFFKVRQAVMDGEEVIIVARQGNLRLTTEPVSGHSVIGSFKGKLRFTDDQLDRPTLPESEWNASL